MRRDALTTRGAALLLVVAVPLVLGACGEPGPSAGSVRALTYNVAGLPEGISGSHPATNTVLISPLLNDYDLVLVQEDFTYHDDLVSAVTHPYQSEPAEPVRMMNDGLNRLARSRFTDHLRVAWEQCNGRTESGADCLADKGFAVATTQLGGGAEVDVYNLHLDAGGDPLDEAARAAQVEQLLGTLATRSAGKAVIVAGDTNLKGLTRPEDEATLQRLLNEAGLVDACRTLQCGDEHIDRFLYRSGGGVTLTATTWAIDGRFVDAAGEDLSDHPAVAVTFTWERQ